MPNTNKEKTWEERIEKEWAEFAETVEADFIEDGFHAHNQVLEFILLKLKEQEEKHQGELKEIVDRIEDRIVIVQRGAVSIEEYEYNNGYNDSIKGIINMINKYIK